MDSNDKGVEVFCFGNGNVAVLRDGLQVPEAQLPWILEVAGNLRKCGIDPLEARVWLPEGRLATFFEVGEGKLNWRISDVNIKG